MFVLFLELCPPPRNVFKATLKCIIIEARAHSVRVKFNGFRLVFEDTAPGCMITAKTGPKLTQQESAEVGSLYSSAGQIDHDLKIGV
jgi:hypothetical protein